MSAEAQRADRIDPAEIEALLARVSLEDIVRGRGVALRRAGRDLLGLCPFHAERSPSFRVFPFRLPGQFRCYGCGASGDAIAFLRQLDGLGFREAVEALGRPQAITQRDRERMDRSKAFEATREARSRRAKLTHAEEIWASTSGLSIAGPVELYLRGRGIDLDAIDPFPRALHEGWVPYVWEDPEAHPMAPRAERFRELAALPAMVGTIQGPDGRLQGVHVTWLQKRPSLDGLGMKGARGGAAAWGKAELADPLTGEILPAKKMFGTAMGGALRLALPDSSGDLFAGEGIETCLSVLAELRRAGRTTPVWALLSLGNFAGGGLGRGPKKPGTRTVDDRGRVRWQRRPSAMPDPGRPGFAAPEGVRRLVWLGDSDGKDPEDGKLMVERGLKRHRPRGIDARVAWAAPGQDFNDMVRST